MSQDNVIKMARQVKVCAPPARRSKRFAAIPALFVTLAASFGNWLYRPGQEPGGELAPRAGTDSREGIRGAGAAASFWV